MNTINPNDPAFRDWVESAASWNGDVARELRDNRAKLRAELEQLAERYMREGNPAAADLRMLLTATELPRDRGEGA